MPSLGYEEILTARNTAHASAAWSGDGALPSQFEVPVSDGPSNYDPEKSPLRINRDEPVGTFLEEVRRPRIRVSKDGARVVATSFPASLEISFNRTLRLPEGDKRAEVVYGQP